MTDQAQDAQLIDPSSATVQSMFSQVMESHLQSGALERAIEKNIANLVESAAKEAMSSYGDLGKKIKELMVAAITPGLSSLEDLPSYHEFVVNRVRAAAQNFYDTRLGEVLDQELAEIITEIPESVTLSWIIEKIKNSIRQDCSCDSGEYSLPMIIEPDGRFVHIYIHDSESDGFRSGDKYSCKYQIHLAEGCIYHLKVDGKETKAKLSFGSNYGVEKVLFHLYALKGKIELDKGIQADEYDLEIDREHSDY